MYTRLCALLLAGQHSLDFNFIFPPSLSQRSVHCITADSDLYKYPTCDLAERQANRLTFPLRLCVCFQATTAPSVSSHLCSHFLVTHLTRSHLSPLATVTCEPVHSAQLTISSPSHLDCCPVTHACGSGNNKLCTPLPLLLHVFSLQECTRVLFYLHIPELSCRLTLRYTMSTSFISPLFALHCFCFPYMPTFALKSRLLPPLNIDCSWIMQLISHLATPIALYGHSPSGLHHPQNT